MAVRYEETKVNVNFVENPELSTVSSSSLENVTIMELLTSPSNRKSDFLIFAFRAHSTSFLLILFKSKVVGESELDLYVRYLYTYSSARCGSCLMSL